MRVWATIFIDILLLLIIFVFLMNFVAGTPQARSKYSQTVGGSRATYLCHVMTTKFNSSQVICQAEEVQIKLAIKELDSQHLAKTFLGHNYSIDLVSYSLDGLEKAEALRKSLEKNFIKVSNISIKKELLLGKQPKSDELVFILKPT